MSHNLLEKVQQSLGYPPLHKIDPNTDDAINHKPVDAFSQALVSAVLTGLYRYVQSNKGAENFLGISNAADWVDEIFGEHRDKAIERIADFASQPVAKVESGILIMVNETKKIIQEILNDKLTVQDIKIFFANERNNIIVYLPPALHLGDWLNDTELDDNTNKMEGPMSNLIKRIGDVFSYPVTNEDLEEDK